jgi:hypothetical protein
VRAHRLDLKLRRPALYSLLKSPLLFLEVIFRSLMIELSLRIFPFKYVVENCLKGRLVFRHINDVHLVERVFKFTAMIENHLSRKPSCLRSSLVLFWMIEHNALLRIGVRKGKSKMDAHAWVERDLKIYSQTLIHEEYELLTSFEK